MDLKRPQIAMKLNINEQYDGARNTRERKLRKQIRYFKYKIYFLRSTNFKLLIHVKVNSPYDSDLFNFVFL